MTSNRLVNLFRTFVFSRASVNVFYCISHSLPFVGSNSKILVATSVDVAPVRKSMSPKYLLFVGSLNPGKVSSAYFEFFRHS